MFESELSQSFLSSAEEWVCDQYAVDTRFIAKRSATGWAIVEASIALWPLPHATDASFTFSDAGYVAGQEQRFPIAKSEATELLRSAAAGVLNVKGLALALPSQQGLSFVSEMTQRDRWFRPLHLRISGRQLVELSPESVSALDSALRLADTPFDGTSDLASWLGLGNAFGASRMPSISITVAPPIDLVRDETALSENSLLATLHAHPSVQRDKVNVAVRAVPGGGLAGRRQVASQIVWSDQLEDRLVGKVELELPNSDSALVMLSLGRETVRREWIIDPKKARNQRYVAVSQFDIDLRMLRSALFDSSDGRKFEQAVALLAHLMGFSAGMPLETDAPDIVLSTPNGQVAVVECTLRLADFGSKSGKLVERRARLTESLNAANLQAGVVAVLVCRLKRNEISALDTELRARGIVLVTAEDLETSLIQSRFVIDPDDVLKRASAAIAALA